MGFPLGALQQNPNLIHSFHTLVVRRETRRRGRFVRHNKHTGGGFLESIWQAVPQKEIKSKNQNGDNVHDSNDS
jgi:hypothetical protein